MGTCDNCGNIYDKAFRIFIGQSWYTFDCFECAIQLLAPACEHCETKIIDHGVEREGLIFCCAHCARESGIRSLTDRTGT